MSHLQAPELLQGQLAPGGQVVDDLAAPAGFRAEAAHAAPSGVYTTLPWRMSRAAGAGVVAGA